MACKLTKMFKDKSYQVVIFLWFLHALSFGFDIRLYPVLNFDLFSRIGSFSSPEERFYARTMLGKIEDISQEVSFDFYWKFIVTVRRMMRESQRDLELAFQRRIDELNIAREDKIISIQFVVVEKSKGKEVLFEVHR